MSGGILDGAIEELIRKVKAWDVIVQPLQLQSKMSGMPHTDSQRTGKELRELAVYLHNEPTQMEQNQSWENFCM